jgi:hypothetical protein
MSDMPAMKEKTLAVLDSISLVLLLLLPVLAILHFLFEPVFTIFAVDNAAWIAFGGPLFLSGLLRWLHEVTDNEVIGPFRLWTAAGTVALVFCMASSFIAAPKMGSLQVQLAAQNISAQQQALFEKEYARVSNFSLQFVSIRAALAVGMALGLKKLPRKKKAGSN